MTLEKILRATSKHSMVSKRPVKRSLKYTTEQFIDKIKSIRNDIEVISEYKGVAKLVTVKCFQCTNVWNISVSNLCSGNACPVCSQNARKISQSLFEKQLLARYKGNIVCLDTIKSNREHCKLLCKVCNHNWLVKPIVIKRSKGCPKCTKENTAKTLRKSHSTFIKEITASNPKIKILSKYFSSHTPIKVKCIECNLIREAMPYNLLNGDNCPTCSFHNTLQNSVKRKSITIQGVEFTGLQGYEPRAIQTLVKKNKIKARNILTGKYVPKFKYHLIINRRYYPDFYIPKLNTIVEVKSTWTLFGSKRHKSDNWFKMLKLKRKAVIEAGYTFKLMVYDETKKIIMPNCWYEMSKKEVKVKLGITT